MRTNKKLLSNMLYSGVFQLLFLITPVITIPYVARVFTPADLGLYATSYSLVLFLVTISSFGMPLYGTREISQADNKKQQTDILSNLWSIQIIVTCVIFFVYTIFTYLFIEERKVYITQGLLLLASIFDISWFFRGIEEIKKTILRSFISKILSIILIYIFVIDETHLIRYILINIIGVLIGNITMVAQLKKYILSLHLKIKIDKSDIKNSFVLLIPQAIQNGKGMLPRVMLVFFESYKEAGIFDQGLKITSILSGVFNSIITAMIPRLSYLVKNDKIENLKEIIYDFTLLIVLISIIIINGTLAISEFFVPLFFGEGYDKIIPVMNIVIFSLIFIASSYFYGQGVMLAFSKDKEYQKVVIVSGFILIFLSIFFTWGYGVIGVSWAYLLSELAIFVMVLYYSNKVIFIKGLGKVFLAPVFLIIPNIFIITKIKSIILITSNFSAVIIYGFLSLIISIVLSIVYLWSIKFDISRIMKYKNNE